MALCNITGLVYLPNGELARSRQFVFRRNNRSIVAEYLGTVLPTDVTTQTNSAGQINVSLLTGSYTVFSGDFFARATVPDELTADFSDIIGASSIPDAPPVWYLQALAARDEAVAAAEDARSDAAEAAASAADASSARDAAYANADVYATVGEGRAAVADGEQFQVVTEWEIIRYRRDSPTSQTEVGRYPTSAAVIRLNEALPSVSPMPRLVPLFSDAVGKVPVWLSEGALDAVGMAPNLRDLAVQDIVRKVPQSSPLVPLIGAGGKVVMWVDADGLQIPGYQKSTSGSVISEHRATVSDGASLSRARWKLAQMRSGVAGAKLKIAGIGDSWWEMVHIPRAVRSALDAGVGLSGEGFRPASSGGTIGPAAWSSVGWTISDGSTSGFNPQYGAGPDGTSVWTNGTTATMSLTGVVATEMHIYSYQHGGTWRYRVDGGGWITVTEATTGAFRTTSITGLSDAAHTLEINTTGNTGTVSMAGIYTTRAVNGAEVLKFGNGGTTGLRVSEYAEYLTAPMADIQPDVAVIILGTNDYRTAGATPQIYTAALEDIVAACRAAVPDIGVVVCVPPQTSGTAVIPLSQYRDAAKLWCAEHGHEYISYLDRWSDYPTANAHGLYLDALHVNDLGASVLASDLLRNLILKDN